MTSVFDRAAEPPLAGAADRIARDTAPAATVVSRPAGRGRELRLDLFRGLARGVDSAAHRGALAAKGATLAVLGSGADVIYPAEHRDLARDITADGAIVSELVPGTPPQKQFFPLRNRIIASAVSSTSM